MVDELEADCSAGREVQAGSVLSSNENPAGRSLLFFPTLYRKLGPVKVFTLQRTGEYVVIVPG
jgi:hypothetical protein